MARTNLDVIKRALDTALEFSRIGATEHADAVAALAKAKSEWSDCDWDIDGPSFPSIEWLDRLFKE